MKQPKQIRIALGLAILGAALVVIAYRSLPAQRFARIHGAPLNSLMATCKRLLQTAIPAGETSVEVPVEHAQLDSQIRRFEPRRIVVSSNSVWMMFGGGKVTGFSVSWAPDMHNQAEWTLTIFDGARERVLLRHTQTVLRESD